MLTAAIPGAGTDPGCSTQTNPANLSGFIFVSLTHPDASNDISKYHVLPLATIVSKYNDKVIESNYIVLTYQYDAARINLDWFLRSSEKPYFYRRISVFLRRKYMAVMLKSLQEVALLRQAGRIVAETYEVLRPSIVPGISTAELDRIAEDFIRSRGATPAYKGYGAHPARAGYPAIPAFPATICVAINDVICHGIPSGQQILNDGDIVGVDVGVRYKGWVGDSCVTFAVGKLDEEAQRLMDVARRCMELGIEQARAGNRLGDIGAAIQTYAASHGFSTVRELLAHGVGRSVHEDPSYPHVGPAGTGLKLLPGMVFTVEPMINAGKPDIRLHADRWTVSTADGSRSAQFEHTIAITDGEPEILTQL
jgi:methionyl aminopeptidase